MSACPDDPAIAPKIEHGGASVTLHRTEPTEFMPYAEIHEPGCNPLRAVPVGGTIMFTEVDGEGVPVRSFSMPALLAAMAQPGPGTRDV
jgi:hypothetical protein